MELHHVFGGPNRDKSTKYGLVVWLCRSCHTGQNGVHSDRKKMDSLRELAERAFKRKYPDEDFLKIFHRDYPSKEGKEESIDITDIEELAKELASR